MSRDNDKVRELYPEQRRKKQIKKKMPSGHKTITIITFLLLTVYICGYLIAFLSRPKTATETVVYGTIDVPLSLDGIIIRDEEVYVAEASGQPYFNYNDNDRIKKGAVVCNVKDEETTSIIESEIKKLDKDILSTQRARSDMSVFSEDITEIESSIKKTVDAGVLKFINSNMSEIYKLKDEIDTQISRRNEIWFSENVKSLTELSEKKNQYENKLSESIYSISSNSSGIISYTSDGFESVLTPSSIDSITEEQIKMKITPKYTSKSQAVKSGDNIFKVVKSNEWYVAAYMNVAEAAQITVDSKKTLSFTIDEEEKSIDFTVEKISGVGDKYLIVFKTDKNMIDFVKERTVSFKINTDAYKGIKIPNEAIVEKTLLKIPLSCIVESVDKYSVMKLIDSSQNMAELVDVDIVKIDSENGFAYTVQDINSLKIGDTLLAGTGENAKTYELNQVEPYEGVFVVNSAVAEFKVITIIAQNSNYAIVSDEDGNYGLKAYDVIVSDATKVNESDAIY
ncbi:MAG: HlyD family efflux transporter periplasmic adaptor subunit [Lachnospiraceae bacterium]|nr:HlyD family efflux transporter periplasmic adaptor subunit [Lachnospiraceae bacterium]